MAGRKIFNEYDAQQCLAAVKRSQAELGVWARTHGIDGRSLNLWRANLARRGRARALSRPQPRLVELVPAAPVAVARAPYVLRIRGVELEVGIDFHDESLRRLVGLLKSC